MEFNEHLPPEEAESVPVVEPLPVKPISSLTPHEREAAKRARDALLDELEAEEAEAEERERQREQATPSVVQKLRKDVKKIEPDDAVRILAAIGNSKVPLPASPSEESQEPSSTGALTNGSSEATRQLERPTEPQKKKGVSFAPDTKTEASTSPPVIRAQLRPGSKPITMKRDIIERFPTGPQNGKAQLLDSDDEDDAPEDIDSLMHQREIALRYHELRDRLGPPVEDDWDKPVSSHIGPFAKDSFSYPQLGCTTRSNACD